jgi:hypothetical protein
MSRFRPAKAGLFLRLKKASGSVNLKTNVKRACPDDVLSLAK